MFKYLSSMLVIFCVLFSGISNAEVTPKARVICSTGYGTTWSLAEAESKLNAKIDQQWQNADIEVSPPVILEISNPDQIGEHASQSSHYHYWQICVSVNPAKK